jgi:hypothetical protein
MGLGGAMKRREFVTAIGAAVTWPFAARTQKTERPTIGFFNENPDVELARRISIFDFVVAETNRTGRRCWQKAIEETIMSVLRSDAFSHSFAP